MQLTTQNSSLMNSQPLAQNPIVNNHLIENIFKFANKELTTIYTENIEPWFKAQDSANLLEYKDTKNAIKKHVSNENKRNFASFSKGGATYPLLFMHPDTIFINESGLYELIMKSRNKCAIFIQKWVCNEVLPKIRKYGEYKTQQNYEKKLQVTEQKMIEYKQEMKQKEEEIDKLKKVVVCCQTKLKSVQKLQNKNESIYIISSYNYARQGLFKIGKTNCIKSRIATLNTSHSANDSMVLIKEIKVFDSKAAEDRIKVILQPLRDDKNREFYQGIYKLLEQLVVFICDNLHDECEKVNEIISQLIESLKAINTNYMEGINMTVFDPIAKRITIFPNQVYFDDNITEKDIEQVLINYLKTKPKMKNIETIQDALAIITKFRTIKRMDLKKMIGNYDSNIENLIQKFILKFNNKLKFK